MNKKVNIIGAGIAGLSAGCYLQMNGYETEIFELHNKPGGLCTSWKRKNYIFDGCIHWLVGSSPADNFYYLWNELIDMKKIEFVNHDEYIRVQDKEGKTMTVFTDVDKLEKEMLDKAPEDRKTILRFTRAVRKLTNMQMPIEKAPQTYNLIDLLKMLFKILPYMAAFKKWLSISAREYADTCRNPLLKKAFELIFLPEMSMSFLIMTMVWMHKKSAGYPIGGSLQFSRSIENKYYELGGKIRYDSRVKEIITQDNEAKGILLENGENHHADIVISAADGYDTIFKMLGARFVDEKIKDFYDNYEIFSSLVQVSLGVARDFTGFPHALYFPLEEPFMIDSQASIDWIGVQVYNFDPTLAPKGHTVITCLLPTYNDSYWQDLRNNDKKKYKVEKERIADRLIDILEKKFGAIKANVKVVDVATPATYIRYTNNWKGSFEGWLLTPMMGMKQIPKVLPGLKNFYMVGQWVEPGGGLPTVLLSGRNIAQVICKKDKRKFITV